MPWSVKKGSGNKKYKIVKDSTGKVVGSSTTKAKALASVRARYASENKPKKKSLLLNAERSR